MSIKHSRTYIFLAISVLLLGAFVLVGQPPLKVSGFDGYKSSTARVSTVAPAVGNGLELVSEMGGGGRITAVDVSGAYAYVGDETGFSVLDVSIPVTPTLYARQVLTDSVRTVQIVGNLAYVANLGGGLKIFDVSDPVHPLMIGGYHTAGQTTDVQVIGDLAYVAYGVTGFEPAGVAIVNVANPAAPVGLSVYEISGSVRGLDVISGTVYLAAMEQGLILLDVTNPLNPTYTGSYVTPGNAEDISVAGGLAYVADAGVGGLQIIDVTMPTTPTLVSSYPTLYYALAVQVIGGFAYVLDSGFGGLQIIDVTTPVSPTLLGVYPMFNPVNMHVAGTQAYVAGGSSGLSILNVTNPVSPTLSGQYMPPMYTGVQVAGNVLYAAAGPQGVQIMDVSDPVSPILRATYPYPTIDVVVADPLAFLNGTNGFQILDVSQPFTPTFLGGYSAPASLSIKKVVGSLAYGIYTYFSSEFYQSNELWVFDVSNPADPVLIGDYYLGYNYYYNGSSVEDMEVRDGLAYMGLQDKLLIVDVSQPVTPTLFTESTLSGTAMGNIELIGHFAYVALGGGGIDVMDVRDPQSPTHAASYTATTVRKLQVVDRLIFTADSSLLVLDRYGLGAVGSYPFPGLTDDLQVAGDLVYVTNEGVLSILHSSIRVERSFLPVVRK